MLLFGALSLSIALKLLGDAMFPPYILKYVSEIMLFTYIGLTFILSVVSYKLISKSYTMLAPLLK